MKKQPVFVITRKFGLFTKIAEKFKKRGIVCFFVKSRKDKIILPEYCTFIYTSPWSIRKYAYMFLAYFRIMFDYKGEIIVCSDNLSDLVLLAYTEKINFFLIGHKKMYDAYGKPQTFRQIRNYCGFLPFDSDNASYDKISIECLELLNELGRKA